MFRCRQLAPFLKLSTGVIFICVSLVSCSIQTPDVNEQRALISKNAFPGGLPLWVSRTAGQGTLNKQYASGLIPQNYADAYAPSLALESNIESDRSVRARLEASTKEQAKVAQEPETQTPSSLSRIQKLCPSLETKVNDAVTTVDANERIKKLSTLTTLCAESADLWLWLGKDYYRQKKMTEASNALQRVVSIDGSNQEAEEILAQIRKTK